MAGEPAQSAVTASAVMASAVACGVGRRPITSVPPDRKAGKVKTWSATW